MKSMIMLVMGKSKDLLEKFEGGAIKWKVEIADFEREWLKKDASFSIAEECEGICAVLQYFVDADDPEYWRRDYCHNNCDLKRTRRI